MKLYTKTGDDGSTGLFGGQRVGKDNLRVEAYGCVDELASMIGLAIVAARSVEAAAPIAEHLQRIQHRLFELGADLATPRPAVGEDRPPVPRIGPEQVREIEHAIDQACAPVPKMTSFILPGGSELAARLHVARAVCRRTERVCVALARHEDIGPDLVVFLNRLSDLLFAQARLANHLQGVPDVPWIGRGRAPGDG